MRYNTMSDINKVAKQMTYNIPNFNAIENDIMVILEQAEIEDES